jgi:putative tricarboxylic transport membrane protein
MIPFLAKILNIPKSILAPLIIFFSLTGVYLISFNLFDLYLMLGFAVVAVWLRTHEFPMAPLLLAFILGGLLEDNLRRTLLLADGDISYIVDRPLGWLFIILILATLALPMVRNVLYRQTS